MFASCGARLSVQRNRISSNALAAVYCAPPLAYQLLSCIDLTHIRYCTNGACADVESNDISECLNSGIVFARCLGSIVGNRLYAIGGNGIVVGMVCAPLVQGNAVEDVAGAGVVCEAGSQAVVRANQIARCRVGLLLQVTARLPAHMFTLHNNTWSQ